MCKTWGARVTGGFFIGIVGMWALTGHVIPPKVGWAVCIGGIIVAAFQVWNRQVTAKEGAQHELEEEKRNHQKAIDEANSNHAAELSQLNQEIERFRDLNTPNLLFHVETEIRMGTVCDIHIELENSGMLPCTIYGRAELQSFVYRDQKPTYNFAGTEIAGKGKRRVTLTAKRVLLASDSDPTIQPAQLHCDVSYYVPQGSKSQYAGFVYVPSKRLFERCI
jgi:hypothetical protein